MFRLRRIHMRTICRIEEVVSMEPMEAWRIISANLWDLYKKRRTETYKGYTEADTEAEVICFEALRKMQKDVSDTNVGKKEQE